MVVWSGIMKREVLYKRAGFVHSSGAVVLVLHLFLMSFHTMGILSFGLNEEMWDEKGEGDGMMTIAVYSFFSCALMGNDRAAASLLQ